MDRLAVLVGGTALVLMAAGCAQSVTARETTISSDDRMSVAPAPPPDPPNAFADEPTAARPRLSRTITLGQGGSETVYGSPGAAPPPAPAQGADPNVTVHNHVTVVQPPVYYYGGYGGYGYGSGARGWNATGARDGAGTTAQPRGAWAPNGWEGAGRTAAPGATPGVGGNFAPAPSFGPAQMK